MKPLYLLIFCLLFMGNTLQADPIPGYIVTKNGKRLTGYINEIFQSAQSSLVVFINDFGTVYHIEPERIRGFVFNDKGRYVAYESKYLRHHWRYLRILEKHQAIDLYQSPEKQHFLNYEDGALRVKSYSVTEYWLEIGDKKPTRIRRGNFKRKIRRMIRRQLPDTNMEDKLGTAGYKFEDLPEIIRECNRLLSARQYTT